MSQSNPYAANVNRAKTKKWVEAKSYSYDGDDWGEVDDYDEYGGYNEPEPEPVSTPTGLRQRGQSASKMPQEAYDARQDIYQSPVDVRQPYENIGRPPPQQQHGGRSFTSPHPKQQPMMVRSNSFDRDDDRRAFSAGGSQAPANQYIPTDHTTRSSQSQDKPMYSPQHNQPLHHTSQPQPRPVQPPSYPSGRLSAEVQPRHGEDTQSAGVSHRGIPLSDQIRQPDPSSRAQSMGSNNSVSEFHNRRDFSPSAVPNPLQTHGLPSPHGHDSRSSSRHPPRKSSLGQDNAPTDPFAAQQPPLLAARDTEPEDTTARNRAGSGASKQLPFVRPADIYRRMQEEKEKERCSQDSSRPSIEGPQTRSDERPILGKSQDSGSSQRLRSPLDPVTERRSEYGMGGMNLEDREASGERRPTSSKTFNFPKQASDRNPPVPQSSLGPMLPDVSRVSGFGESFFGSTGQTEDSVQDSMLNFGKSFDPPEAPEQTRPPTETGLQHQPSVGFTSAVHQAFDTAEDQVPPTPSSTQGSSIARSASGGTNTISPIISRGPSTATDNWNSRLPGIDNVSTPMIPERPEGNSSRPLSSESITTPTQIARDPSLLHDTKPQESEKPPPSFIPGYRRDSDPPSPDNSPRRTPALETTRQLRRPQEVELAAATPTEPSHGSDTNSVDSGTSSEEEPSKRQPTQSDPRRQHIDTYNLSGSQLKDPGRTGSPMSPGFDPMQGRTDSPSSSRVRNLADKFESVSRPGSEHSTTPRASFLGTNALRKEDPASSRPLVDHRESFRPHLPGGWESSASIAPAIASKPTRAPFPQQDLEQDNTSAESAYSPTTIKNDLRQGTVSSSADQQPSSVTQIKDASEEAFAAVAAAGSALVGAFGAAVGIEQHDPSTTTTPEAQSTGPSSKRSSQDSGSIAKGRDAMRPEASRSYTPLASDDKASTTSPTALPKSGVPPFTARTQAPGDSAAPSEQGVESDVPSIDVRRSHPPPLPLLSTDNRPEQYESDRLRKEIVRELTPMSASEPTTAETDNSIDEPTLSTNPSVTRSGHDSGFLPKEYESYWNDGSSEEEGEIFQQKPAQADVAVTAENSEALEAVVVPPLHLSQDRGLGSLAPLAQDDPTQGRPQMLPHRFSWEQPLQEIPVAKTPPQEQMIAPTSTFLQSAIYPQGHSHQPREQSTETYTSPTVQTASEPPKLSSPVAPDKDLPSSLMRDSDTGQNAMTYATKSLPEPPRGLEPAPTNLEEQPDGSPTPDHIGGQSSLGTTGDHPPHQREGYDSPQIDPPLIGPSPPQVVQIPPMPPPTNAQLKFPPFREILALKDPNDRIRAYNETRDQFANLNTGLAHWLAVTTNDLPEHADLLTSSGRPAPIFQGHRPSQSRSKLGSLLPSGGQAQQPQSQQYLNVNSGQLSAPDGSVPGNGMGDGSPQGMSPSGSSSGKLSSQQVQAKGKDLLHSAGVFGGKANFAAKGLFSKGKSKLRAASGNEKGTSPSSFGLETQQQHNAVKPQTSTKALLDLRPNSGKAVAQTPSPEPQSSSQSSRHETNLDIVPDTPSAESSSQSQLGDDEYSEESEPTNQAHPPRTASMNPKHGLAHSKDSRTLRDSPTIEGNASFFHKKTSSTDSYVESPKTIHTPRSTTSSENRTPTQASFANRSPSATLRSNRLDEVETSLPRREALENTGTHTVDGVHSGRIFPGDIQSSSPILYSPDVRNTAPFNHHAIEPNKTQKQSSSDSKSTVRYVKNEGSLSERAGASSKAADLPKAELDLISRAPARMTALAASEVSFTARDASRAVFRTSRSRPVSSSRDSLGVPGANPSYPNRGKSIDIQPDGPISPISPSQLTAKDAVEHGGRTGPIHYGLDHDFVPDSDHERIRRRSRSYSKSSAITRPSQESCRSQDHPFRLSSDVLSPDYSGQIAREKSPAPVQQAPEYHIEGTSPPLEWPTESTSRSRRGSKSSAFFRSLTPGNSPRPDEHPLPSPSEARSIASPVAPPAKAERKEKRPGILRSLTRNSGGGTTTGQGNPDSNPAPSAPSQGRLTQAVPTTTSQIEDDEFPSRGKSRSAASKFGKRLQRSSTSGNPEQNTTKKKRFSAIGSLFGRSNPKRHSSSASPQTPSQQPPLPGSRQSGLDEDYNPPPPGGYYAPRPLQAHVEPPPPVPNLPRDRRSSHWTEDAPAYVQDTQLRQSVNQRVSSPPHNYTSARSSKTFPQAKPHEKSKEVPRASTTRSKSRENVPEQANAENKPSARSWARFSQHKRSKSRQEHQAPSSQTASSKTPTSNPTPAPAPSRGFRMSQQPYHDPSRPESPPPPPPPPKDKWHQARPRESVSSNLKSRPAQHSRNPSHTSSCPISGQTRESLPPLRTNISNKKRQSAIALAKTMTPEEKRKSRQLEIERSTLSPDYREPSDEEPPVVMSATSFPGQSWQPEYAHWDGD